MSGWGMAKNRINKFVVACENYSQAEEIVKKAHKRSEMKYVRIARKMPYYSPNRYITSWRKYREIHW
jgi:transketolase C-terminal domain/subunit